ncbi:MAG: hypothetical protein KDA24_09160 [Deltaproteobacteria bacterium]|nr:hypothetical protein [Deltaproteobacteria bacterium]
MNSQLAFARAVASLSGAVPRKPARVPALPPANTPLSSDQGRALAAALESELVANDDLESAFDRLRRLAGRTRR